MEVMAKHRGCPAVPGSAAASSDQQLADRPCWSSPRISRALW